MKRVIVSIIFAFLTFSVVGQGFTVKGTVKDTQGTALPFANVFFAETTFGTTSNNDGGFVLEIPQAGTYDLVVRFVGYQTFAAQLKLEEQPVVNLNIVLEEDAVSLGTVTVRAEKDEQWMYQIQAFKREFLGLSANARKCKIINEQDIDFIEDPQAGTLVAFANGPIVVVNKGLGYKISYYLEDFTKNYKTGISSYFGYTSFEPLKGSKRQEKKWEAAREKAFNGSIVHFFSSLYENKLSEEGFNVQIAQDVEGLGRVLNPRTADLSKQLLLGNTNLSKRLPFENYLYITYGREAESEAYQNSKTRFGARHASVSKTPERSQQSWISMMEGYEDIEFEQSGYVYNPIAFYSAGYWGFEKIAEMVPINYRPKNEKE